MHKAVIEPTNENLPTITVTDIGSSIRKSANGKFVGLALELNQGVVFVFTTGAFALLKEAAILAAPYITPDDEGVNFSELAALLQENIEEQGIEPVNTEN